MRDGDGRPPPADPSLGRGRLQEFHPARARSPSTCASLHFEPDPPSATCRFTHVDWCRPRGLGRAHAWRHHRDRTLRPDQPAQPEVAFNISDHFRAGHRSRAPRTPHDDRPRRRITEFTAECAARTARFSVFSDACGSVVVWRTVSSRRFVSSKPTEASRPWPWLASTAPSPRACGPCWAPKSWPWWGPAVGSPAIGNKFLANLKAAGFARPDHPVSRTPTRCSGSRGAPALRHPRSCGSGRHRGAGPCRPRVVDECADIGVRHNSSSLPVSPRSGGGGAALRNLGPAGAGCRDAGRGSNSFGLINTDPDVHLNASLSPDRATTGVGWPVRPVRGRSASRGSSPPPPGDG